MLKKIMNQARIKVQITPVDPLLIKSGQATVGGVNMAFVRTYRFGEEDQPYIPGSSLKGVIRSYAERICRSLRENPVPVCLPYVRPGQEQPGEGRQASCGHRFDQLKIKLAQQDIYRLSCPACRLFGSLGFAGRFSVSDAYLNGGHQLEIRDGVAIDRITGGAVPGAKYDLEILSQGSFVTTLELRNFERWQLGLIALVLRDMEEAMIHIGSGKSRGLGRIQAKILDFEVSYYNREVSSLTGLGGLCSSSECESYGFLPETSETREIETALPAPDKDGLRRKYSITEIWKDAMSPAVDDLLAYIGKVDWPEQIEKCARGKI